MLSKLIADSARWLDRVFGHIGSVLNKLSANKQYYGVWLKIPYNVRIIVDYASFVVIRNSKLLPMNPITM